MAICEKVWLEYKGFRSREGIPFLFLLRDILQYDETVTDAINRIIAARRTCSIWIGLGDTSNNFNIVAYSPDQIGVYNDMNLEVNNPAHPQLKDVVYVDKHPQPSHDTCLGELLTKSSFNNISSFQNPSPFYFHVKVLLSDICPDCSHQHHFTRTDWRHAHWNL